MGATRVLIVAACLWGLVACGDPPPASSVAASGERRIVSLSPALTRTLLVLGARDELVAVDRYSRRLPGLASLPSLGGVFHPDLERTLELRPTLVLGVAGVEQRPFFNRLREQGIEVREIAAQTLAEVLASFERVGAALGRAQSGAELAARVRAELGAIERSTAGRPRPRVALVLERDPLYVVGRGAFLGELIGIAGGKNVFADLRAPYPRVSLEALAERRPDVILDSFIDPSDPQGSRLDLAAYWGRFAWAGRVEPLTADATQPGPELARTARELRARIHPDLDAP
ncbi:MAG: ABC transporter substrate-binding protein [Myxococcota bacterium]